MKSSMNKSKWYPMITIIVMIMTTVVTYGQLDTFAMGPATKGNQVRMNPWLANLYEIGVVVKGDSLIISDEAKQVATNADLRKIIYPAEYTLKTAQALLVQTQIKVGTWYMINLYAEDGENKNTILQYMLALDKKVDMEKVLVSSFYTYIFFDPQASTIKDGKPDIQHPEILENKLAVINELSEYLEAARNME